MEISAREEFQKFCARIQSCRQDLEMELREVLAREIGLFSFQGINLGEIFEEFIKKSTENLVTIFKCTGEVLLENKIKEWTE